MGIISYFNKKHFKNEKTNNNREIFADLLRTIAIFFVIVIHTTCTHLTASYGTSSFKWVLLVNAIASIAVPIFFMLSGCFLIKKDNIVNSKNTKRIIKRVYQLLIWTLIYLLFEKYYLGWDIDVGFQFIQSLFRHQVPHLWFMYPLIALYLLSPIVSKLYYALDKKHIKYLLLFTFFIPLLMKWTIDYHNFVSIPLFALGFSEFSYFILGKYIYDNIDDIKKKIDLKTTVIVSMLGLLLIIIYAFYDSFVFGMTNNPYFDYSRFPCALYCVSFYTVFILLKDKLQKIPDKFKRIISNIAVNSGGIYYIHMIFAQLLSPVYILGIGFTSNHDSLLFMILGAILYFTLSWFSINILKKIPYIKELIN
ncbi:MAG: acyltransferase family protein [Mollicutes bacterium]|nr:acyltransferase family protein [Mollicutes bacterium]